MSLLCFYQNLISAMLDHYLLSATNILTPSTHPSFGHQRHPIAYFQITVVSLYPEEQISKLLCPEFRALPKFPSFYRCYSPVMYYIVLYFSSVRMSLSCFFFFSFLSSSFLYLSHLFSAPHTISPFYNPLSHFKFPFH